MPAAVPIIAAVIAAGATTASMIQSNQQVQHAKGAAEAEQTAMKGQLDQTKSLDDANKKATATNASSTQAAALAALRASMGTSGSMGGTILTGPQGAAPAPTQTKTLLGV